MDVYDSVEDNRRDELLHSLMLVRFYMQCIYMLYFFVFLVVHLLYYTQTCKFVEASELIACP